MAPQSTEERATTIMRPTRRSGRCPSFAGVPVGLVMQGSPNPIRGIYGNPVSPKAPVKMRTRRPPAFSQSPDGLTKRNELAGFHIPPGKMAELAGISKGVCDGHTNAAAIVPKPGFDDHARSGGEDPGAYWRNQIDSIMKSLAGGLEGIASCPKPRRHLGSQHRPRKYEWPR